MSNRIQPAVADESAPSPLADIGAVTSDLDAPAVRTVTAVSAEAEAVAEMIAAAMATPAEVSHD